MQPQQSQQPQPQRQPIKPNKQPRIYSTEPCFDDCWGDGICNAHYHQINGHDMVQKVEDALDGQL